MNGHNLPLDLLPNLGSDFPSPLELERLDSDTVLFMGCVKSSKSTSPGGSNPDLKASITSWESWNGTDPTKCKHLRWGLTQNWWHIKAEQESLCVWDQSWVWPGSFLGMNSLSEPRVSASLCTFCWKAVRAYGLYWLEKQITLQSVTPNQDLRYRFAGNTAVSKSEENPSKYSHKTELLCDHSATSQQVGCEFSDSKWL